MANQPNMQIPGHFTMNRQRAMLLPPEQLAAPTEALSEQMFIERSLTENQAGCHSKKIRG